MVQPRLRIYYGPETELDAPQMESSLLPIRSPYRCGRCLAG